MHIYCAAVYTNGYRAGGNSGRYAKLTDGEKVIVDAVPHLLESYHYVSRQRFVDAMREDNVKVFLDSGAFSAHTLGVKVDAKAYADYINRNRDIIRVEDDALLASVLDGIGDPLKTWQNQQELERYGAPVLPCFHYGEDERYLEHYIAKYGYITLGGMVPISTPMLIVWLDRLWEKYLTDGSGRPRLKVHGFGVTSLRLMERYPWYSCDSSSWVQTAAFGSVFIPGIGPLNVSSTSPSRHVMDRHITTLPPIVQESIEKQVGEIGFNMQRLSTVYESRAAFNLYAYTHMNIALKDQATAQFTRHTQTLFDDADFR